MEEEKKTVTEEIKCQIEDEICNISEERVQRDNVDYLGKLVDIHKDLANEEYWLKKEEFMMYRGYGRNYYGDYDREEYGNYGRGRRRDSRGRYMESRYSEGRGRRYRGHDMIDEMADHYGNYSEGKEEYSRGNYGAKEDTMKSLEYMLQSVEDFMMMLQEDASSQEEVDMIKHTARKISEM